jgi:microcystin-dependent protein
MKEIRELTTTATVMADDDWLLLQKAAPPYETQNVSFSTIKNSVGATPAGFVGTFAGASAPAGWLLCDGAAVSRTTYADLFTAISTVYGVGDNSTTFNVPDMRETLIVGVGTRGAGVTAHDTYTLGQFKDDQEQGHFHNFNIGTVANNANADLDTTCYAASRSSSGSGHGRTTANATPSSIMVIAPITDGTNGTPRTGTTTHGKQIGMNYIIKY